MMKRRLYRSIGEKVAPLGFGCMRFPKDADGNVSWLKSTRLLRLAFRKGVNYYDTAYIYDKGDSERILGHAVKPFRDKVIISTKNPFYPEDTPDTWLKRLDESVERLGTEPDILSFHYIRWKIFREKTRRKRTSLLVAARKAQARGVFKHLAFSCHDTPGNIIKFIDTGEFVGVTVQYNLLDRVNERVMAYAHNKGMGVVIMGPVGGGRLAVPSERLQRIVPGGVHSTPEIALRFVLANPNVTIAMSGMNTRNQLMENLRVARMRRPLSPAEKRKVRAALRQISKLAQLYCTGCGYCMPCPNKVNIPLNFQLMNLYRVWGLKELAREQYATLTDPKRRGLNASYCKECGKCMKKCPQKIDIIGQLRETHEALGR